MPFEISGGTSITPGTYKGQLMRVESGVPTSFGNARKWYWLVDVNGQGQELSVLTSENTGPQSKAYRWLTALLGREPQAGERIEDPTGKTVMLTVGTNAKGFATIEGVTAIVEPQQIEAGIPR